MPVSRKNRSMKKSSMRSKNVRTSNKTRKHLRKMRGGGVSDVEQVVDFIIYSDNKVLVSPNSNVVDGENNLALIGTFANASVLKEGTTKIYHSQKKSIEDAIKNKVNNTTGKGLVPLENLNAFLLLEKSLEDKMLITPIRKYLVMIKPVEGKKFRKVLDDKRLATDCKPTKGKTCAIFTQLFSVNVDNNLDARNLFLPKEPKDGKPLMFVDLKSKEAETIFKGHLRLLRNSKMFEVSENIEKMFENEPPTSDASNDMTFGFHDDDE